MDTSLEEDDIDIIPPLPKKFQTIELVGLFFKKKLLTRLFIINKISKC